MVDRDRRSILGWIAIAVSTMIACFWAYWGAIENFHEGWYQDTFLKNLILMLGQYLSPMICFVAITTISIKFHRLGGLLHIVAAGFVFWYFGGAEIPAAFSLLLLPLLFLGFLYWFGKTDPKRWAYRIAVGLPLLTLCVGIPGAVRVSQRFDDGNLGERIVEGNGVSLKWAGEGDGYPQRGGKNWAAAIKQCRLLNADGRTLAETPQDIWHLPTADEAVRSMSRHGQNSGGIWDPGSRTATYSMEPDKESPLWNSRSQVIYWWTATEIDEAHAYMIAYDGKVWPRNKSFAQDYFAFRCVSKPSKSPMSTQNVR